MNEAGAIGALTFQPSMVGSSLLLGIDGGGTKTEALLATADGTLVGRGFAGVGNYHKAGFATASSEIERAIHAAFSAAQRHGSAPGAIAMGMAGVDRAEDVRLFEQWAEERFPGVPVVVVNDAELVLPAGTPDGWGIGIICGTGATCVGRNQAEKLARADGWGHLLGDDGSGYWMGMSALRAILRAVDGRGAATMLRERVLEAWQIDSTDAILTRVYIGDAPPAQIAALAPLVLVCAEAGDEVATSIVKQAGESIALAIHAVSTRLAMNGAIPLGLAGGLVTKSDLMRRSVLDAAYARGLCLTPVALVDQPAIGAIRLAQRLIAR